MSRVFSKFVEQGKATIRFKEPAHDLSISKANTCVQYYMCKGI